jgi:hypothetical protein
MLNETNFTALAFSKIGTTQLLGSVVGRFILPGFPPRLSLTGLSAILLLWTLVSALFSGSCSCSALALTSCLTSALALFPIDYTIGSAQINCPRALHSCGIQPLSPYPKGLM